jgi:hypothetical protein
LKCLDYLGWLISFGNASGKPEPFDILRWGRGRGDVVVPHTEVDIKILHQLIKW